MTTADMDLLGRWRAGDLPAGDTLIRRHYGWAFAMARRRLRDDDSAAEAVQHAMTIVVHKRDEIDSDFRLYLRKVVYFSVLSQTRRRHHQSLPRDAAVDPQRGASAAVAERQQTKLLVKALRSIPVDDQLLFYFDFVSDHSRTEIAALLGIPHHRIYARVHRAKQRLRDCLESFEQSPVRQSTLGGFDTWLASVHRKAPDVSP